MTFQSKNKIKIKIKKGRRRRNQWLYYAMISMLIDFPGGEG